MNMNMMMMKMVHHNHHHRPFSSPFDVDVDADGDGDGPTPTHYYTSLTNHHHHHNINSASSVSAPPLGAVPAIDGASAAVRNLQPFDISPYTSATTTPSSAFISSAGGAMASSLGFPFTSAQWKELERQAMIYKYMMASVPVPPDLLIPNASTRSPLDGGFNLRLSRNGTDPEPGRCKRTDGKKWRCSRDVAPNHKYCERHMHRGRPRSRKPVEVHNYNNNINTISNNNNKQQQQQMKRARHDCVPFANSGVTVAISNPSARNDGPSSSSSHFVGSAATTQPYLESSLSLANFGSSKEPRGLEWMLNGDPISMGASESEWHSLMQSKVGLSAMSSCSNAESQYLNSFALYGSDEMDQHNRRQQPMFLNPLVVPMEETLQSEKPRGFIDAWSNSGTEENNANHKNSVSPIGKLSLASLDLSMGGGYVHEDMGLGLMEHGGNSNDNNTHNNHSDSTKANNLSNWLTPSSAPWLLPSTTPGGPLAEVLRPSTVTTASASNSNPPSPAMTTTNAESNSRTMVSSPSGVLHKTLASLSDSSGNSSPTVASSGTNSQIALLRFNHKSN